MWPASGVSSRTGSRAGVALVLVLAFIVLLAILVVSFISFMALSRSATASYSKSIQAQEVAQGGIEDILGDIRAEMITGSIPDPSGTTYTQGTNTVYVPMTNYTAVPARIGYTASLYGNDISTTALPPTLIRVSRASQDGIPTDFYPPLNGTYYANTGTTPIPQNWASPANSSTNSANGREISATRWNKIDLLTTNNATIPPAFATNTPDWVYVTRAGRRICSIGDLTSANPILPSSNLTNSSPVTGRYAYAIYDESALLDINAVGYVSSAGNATYGTWSSTGVATNAISTPTTNNPARIAQSIDSKSYLAYADLTQLPGLSGAQATVIDPLIQWRNASVNLSTASTAASNYFQNVFSNANSGFLIPNSSANGTDSPLVSRQDLINYFAKIDPSGTTYAQALPYLGTFSRALNAPSWHPTADSANLNGYYGTKSSYGYTFVNVAPVTYKTSQESTTDSGGNPNANPDIPNVRYAAGTPAGTTITHYYDDGMSFTYSVQAGDPLVQSRFSLAKLAWLTYKGPSADLPASDSLYNAGGTDANILACFGLKWNPQNFAATPVHYDRWDYVAATTNNVHIETLNEIAAGSTATANPGYREPNFFEMLKAGILSGSVGQSPGPISTGNNAEGVDGTGFDTFSSEKNRHILQIGVNIIDQAHADSIPTAIYLALFGVVPPATSLSNEDDLAFNTVYGDKNLPGLTRVYQTVIEDWYDTVAKQGYMKSWIIPEVWNIHQVPATGNDMTVAGTPGYPHPTQFRVHAYGKFAWNLSIGNTPFPSVNLDWDDIATANPYHDTTGSPPTGAPATIMGSQTPASNAVTSTTAATSPADLVYFSDFGSANSPFYRFPNFLQFGNLFTNGRLAFQGTHLLNEWSTPTDNNLAGDNNNTQVEFGGVFGGEMTLPDLTPYVGGNIQDNVSNTIPIYFSLECQDPITLHWHPYSFISRLDTPANPVGNSLLGDNGNSVSATNPNYVGTPGTGNAANGWTFSASRGSAMVRADPRTDRFSVYNERMFWSQHANSTMNPGAGNPTTVNAIEDRFPMRTYGFVYNPDQGPSPGGDGANGDSYIASWAINTAVATANTAFYVDPDGVVRPGDSYIANQRTGDGYLLYHGCLGGDNVNPPPTSPSTPNTSPLTTSPNSLLPTSTTAAGASAPTGSAQARRPVILNRPYRSVGELGYAFRDLPFKTLDFFTQSSGDAALLDLFSISDEPTVAAGEINPSNIPISSLNAILMGTTKMEIDNPVATALSSPTAADSSTSATAPSGANFMSYNAANKLDGSLVASFNPTTAFGPIANRADLVARIAYYNSKISVMNQNYVNKAYAEAPVRALSGLANTRTWNLLIDIIAQSGQMSPKAATLNDFVVQGERRYWLHIAIDRYTGRIIDQQLEPVYE